MPDKSLAAQAKTVPADTVRRLLRISRRHLGLQACPPPIQPVVCGEFIDPPRYRALVHPCSVGVAA